MQAPTSSTASRRSGIRSTRAVLELRAWVTDVVGAAVHQLFARQAMTPSRDFRRLEIATQQREQNVVAFAPVVLDPSRSTPSRLKPAFLRDAVRRRVLDVGVELQSPEAALETPARHEHERTRGESSPARVRRGSSSRSRHGPTASARARSPEQRPVTRADDGEASLAAGRPRQVRSAGLRRVRVRDLRHPAADLRVVDRDHERVQVVQRHCSSTSFAVRGSTGRS